MKNKNFNLGICPKCNEYTHFHILKRISQSSNIMLCELCKKEVMQYINGSVKYESVDMNFFARMSSEE